MEKIDLEKLICSLAKRKYFSEEKLQGALKEQGLEYKDGDIVEIPKPKFKVGDWVVLKNGGYFSSGSKTVRIKDIIGKEVWFETDTWLFEDEIRHWTIQDAKDGDVLRLGCITAIFKEYIGQEKCICYCSISEDGDFEILIEEAGDNILGCINTTPATKEERKLLFQKMKEAGYEWDAEKKELKKIEHIDEYEGLTNFERTVADICIGWIGKELGWKEYIKDNADVLLKIAIKKFNKDFATVYDYEHANIQQKDFAPKATAANRQLYNRAILKILSNYVEKYPDIRFGQMLCNLGIKPYFDEESKETYCNLNETINKQK